jgi:signal transduction histidine kinase
MDAPRTSSRFLRPHSIRARMTLAFAVFNVALIGILGLAFYIYMERQERRRADDTLRQAIEELREELEEGDYSKQNIAHVVREESSDLHNLNVAVIVIDATGKVIAHSSRQAASWPLPREWRSNSFQYAGHTLAVALPWSRMKENLRDRTQVLLIMGGLVVLCSSLGAWVLVGRTLSPLDGLVRQASAASAETLLVQLDTPSSDAEMVSLVSTLNDLLNRLSQTVQAQGRFYAAASHELRTPLHGLSLLQEVALSRPRSAQEYADALTQSHAQTQRLTRLVQDLLLLNQLEMDTSHPAPVLLDLADICEGELAHLQPVIEKKKLQVNAPLPPVCELTAPWTHITMLLRNLMENAVKYAGVGGRVEMQVAPSQVRIWNQCEIPQNFEAEKYFEPFYRPDASRNSQTGGNGLGLSICRAICETNDWHLDLCVENGGISAIVQFS